MVDIARRNQVVLGVRNIGARLERSNRAIFKEEFDMRKTFSYSARTIVRSKSEPIFYDLVRSLKSGIFHAF